MKSYVFGLLLLVLGAAGCSGDGEAKSSLPGDARSEKTTQVETKGKVAPKEDPPSAPAETPAPDYTFDGKRAGQFRLGAPLPTTAPPFTLKKQTKKVRGEEGVTLDVVTVVAAYNGTPHLELKATPGHAGESPGDQIDEITILSDQYKTPEGFGVGTKLDEFTYNYPQFKLFYSYVSDRYWAENGIDPMQFNLDGTDYTKKLVIDSDLMDLDPNDFKLSATIRSIRIF